MKKKWTNQKVFDAIIEQLKEAGKYPEIIDYDLHAYKEHALSSIEVKCIGRLTLGCSEGIYIDLHLEGVRDFIKLGTIKTLHSDHEGWMTMAAMMAEFQWLCGEFIWMHRKEIEV